MAKTIQQAEAELRTAALEYADAHQLYSDAFDRNGDMRRYEGLAIGEQPGPMHPETEAACQLSNEKQMALARAAQALRTVLRNEQRAEAL